MKYLITIPVFLTLFSLFVCGQDDKEKLVPGIKVDQPYWDFGAISDAQRASHTFIITNTGNGILDILGVNTTCGCVAAMPEPAKILPGKECNLTVSFDPKGRSGIFTGEIRVVTNVPDQVQFFLSIKARIYQEIDGIIVSGRYFSFGEFERGVSLDEKTIWITSLKYPKFKILSAKAAEPYFTVNVKKEEFSGITSEVKDAYTIGVVPNTDISYGRHETHLDIQTDIPNSSPLRFEIFARVAGMIGTTRDFLAFGFIKPNTKNHKHFFLFHRRGNEVIIKDIKSTLPFCEVKCTPEIENKYYRIDVTISYCKSLPDGEFRGFINIFTADKEQPLIEIWVQGIVKHSEEKQKE